MRTKPIINKDDYYIHKSTTSTVVNSPEHYQSKVEDLKIEAIDAMRAAFGNKVVEDFCICNAFKYVYRHKDKGGDIDIRKAIWYLNKYLNIKALDPDI